jgi:hypothetical protein
MRIYNVISQEVGVLLESFRSQKGIVVFLAWEKICFYLLTVLLSWVMTYSALPALLLCSCLLLKNWLPLMLTAAVLVEP